MNATNLSKKLEENTFLRQTIVQIKKDFFSIGIELFLNSKDIDELIIDLEETLKCLTFENHMQLAYIVDIEEKKIREWLMNGGDLLIFTKMIVHREALKVFIRNEYIPKSS